MARVECDENDGDHGCTAVAEFRAGMTDDGEIALQFQCAAQKYFKSRGWKRGKSLTSFWFCPNHGGEKSNGVLAGGD